MKKFIKKISIFSLLLLILALLMDYAVSKGLREMEDYRFQTWDAIMDSKINSDVLIMGNSRAFSHFNPSIIDSILSTNSYNLGIGGYPFNVQYSRYKLYLQHNKKPKVIIQNVDFLTLTYFNFEHLFKDEQFFPFVYDSLMRQELLESGFSYMDVYCPLYRYFGYQMVLKNGILEFSGLKHYNARPSYKGYRPEFGGWNGTELSKLKNIDGVLEPKMVALFDHFLSDCKNSNVNVVLVNSPVYYKATEKVTNMDSINSTFNNLAKRYGYHYLNYTKDYWLCKDTSYFSVSIHLNSKGAKIFSTQLSKDLDSLGVLK